MDRFGRVVENLSRLGTTMFAIRNPGTKPITRDPEYVLLSMLMKENLTASEIVRRLHRSKPCISALLGRLLREGKIDRLPSQTDHRVTRIAITGTGRRAVRAKRKELKERIHAILAPLSTEDIGRIDACLTELNTIIAGLHLEEHTT